MCAIFCSLLSSLQEWQTLAAGLMALGAAWWTVTTMQKQIDAEKERHEDTLRRKKFAACAKMPDALSEICHYAGNCIKFRIHGGTKPEPPLSALSILEEVIEYIDTNEAEKTYKILTLYD